ncbi:MAG: DUF421 domain-containing protein [Cytophaga sp.]|uniref:DUF421 domain-containing protein n=1 Tax=Cytophaga sp. TaxID=29535 RepID=UPI003F7DBA19
MEDIFIEIFGTGKELSPLQMSCRAIVIFIIALVLIRISGRRSFGIKTPLDNIISILLGAILSRAVVGASPFIPIVTACLVLVIIHRFLGWIKIKNTSVGKFVEGSKILLFENGRFIEKNMKRALVCQEDIMQAVRKSALTDHLERIDKVYMERNGEISTIKKQSS